MVSAWRCRRPGVGPPAASSRSLSFESTWYGAAKDDRGEHSLMLRGALRW